MWDLIVSVPDHCLSFYFLHIFMLKHHICCMYCKLIFRILTEIIDIYKNDFSINTILNLLEI